MMRVLVLLLLFVTSSYQQCNTSIIRDIIQGGNGKADFLASLIGANALPLLDGSNSVELVHGSNPSSNSPIFQLNDSFYITAVDLQFGSTSGGVPCNQNVMVEEMTVIRIGDGDPPTVPVQIGYTNSDGRINLLELGDPNDNRIIRLKLNPTMGRFIRYTVSCYSVKVIIVFLLTGECPNVTVCYKLKPFSTRILTKLSLFDLFSDFKTLKNF